MNSGNLDVAEFVTSEVCVGFFGIFLDSLPNRTEKCLQVTPNPKKYQKAQSLGGHAMGLTAVRCGAAAVLLRSAQQCLFNPLHGLSHKQMVNPEFVIAQLPDSRHQFGKGILALLGAHVGTP